MDVERVAEDRRRVRQRQDAREGGGDKPEREGAVDVRSAGATTVIRGVPGRRAVPYPARMDGIAAVFAELGAAHWLALGLVLLVAELSTGTTYLLWPAVAAWVTGLLLFFLPLALPAQLTVFAAITLATTLTGRHYLKGRLLGPGGDGAMNDRARQLVGATGIAATGFEHGVGRVKLGDTEWCGQSSEPIAAGDALVVTAVEGATLHVRRS